MKWEAIIIILLAFSSLSNEDRISWSERRYLSWSDFKGSPEQDGNRAALTASGISYRFIAMQRRHHVEMGHYEISAYFYPKDSWYKKELASEDLLSHEQLHFDITELHARKFRKLIRERKEVFTEEIKEEIKVIYNAVLNELNIIQEAYDRDILKEQNKYKIAFNSHKPPEKQQEWEEFIEQELIKLNAYQ